MKDWREPVALLCLALLALVISGIHPHDRLTWVLEILPVVIGIPILVATARRFPFTRLAYRLIFAHAILLMAGGHYTYELVPLGEYMRAALGLARNDYDRLGHFAQGFVPAIIAREVLVRLSVVKRGGWLFLFVTAICLSFSALFEMVEWTAATLLGADANAYLATQGDPWDTQWDMFLALVGAITAQILLGSVHDAEMRERAA